MQPVPALGVPLEMTKSTLKPEGWQESWGPGFKEAL